ncbi:MAG: xanthine dehydrogenase family protein molybdopterin-binding subunit, partial [Alphaproteobacteria bacterium]|nr:xanthine dehydrogenase family protein molybdopterin-binding subunit [Alphaproteobacteria bacterium]MBV9153134.1 xanthine dehydrogenase family protein molybdopterin-binding subunit [Alphaproteobacteria bacterium]
MAVQAIGEGVRREEDFRLLTGRGRYVDDVPAIGPHGEAAARGYVLRAPHAHGRVLSIDVAQAKAAPGVLAVLTGADLKRRGLGTLRPLMPRRKKNGGPAFVCPQPLLAQDYVRYVGDPVAFIVAETPNQARDAAELIQVD